MITLILQGRIYPRPWRDLPGMIPKPVLFLLLLCIPVKHLFSDTLPGIFAPAHTGDNIIEDDKSTGRTGYLHLIGEDFNLFTALRADLQGKGGCPEI